MTDTTHPDTEVDLFTVAHDLLRRAAEENKNGNAAAANKLLLAAGNIMGETMAPTENGKAGPPNGTQQVAELLRGGWLEVSEITEKTGIGANRIHVIIGRLKTKSGGKLETQSVKRYRLVEAK